MVESTQNEIVVVGKRKTASARVRIRPGTGKITVNDKPFETHFPEETWRGYIRQPLELTGHLETFDIQVRVQGGGLCGQAGAVRVAIARALNEYDEELRHTLKESGMLTRDSRKKERKKYGQLKARKKTQYSKR